MVKTVIFLCLVITIVAGNPCAQKPDVSAKECCDFPMPLEGALVEACMGKFGAQTQRVMVSMMSGGPMRGACVAECLSNATGLMNEGQVNTELLVAGFKMAADGKAEWDPVIEKTIGDCSGMVQALGGEFDKAAALPPLDPADPICDARPGFMFFCSVKSLFLSCPAKYYKASPQCDSLKKYAETCPIGF
ncbi:hypothetical protein DMENIID0001_071290 [Sergentomyia squamirostris]